MEINSVITAIILEDTECNKRFKELVREAILSEEFALAVKNKLISWVDTIEDINVADTLTDMIIKALNDVDKDELIRVLFPRDKRFT